MENLIRELIKFRKQCDIISEEMCEENKCPYNEFCNDIFGKDIASLDIVELLSYIKKDDKI